LVACCQQGDSFGSECQQSKKTFQSERRGPELCHHRYHCRTALPSLPIVLKFSFRSLIRSLSAYLLSNCPYRALSHTVSLHVMMKWPCRHAAAQGVLGTGPRMEHLICRLQELAHVVTDESVLIHGDFRLGNVILDPLDDYNVVRPPTFRSFHETDAFHKVHLSTHCVG
jgi:hypothetical protein